MNGSTLNDVLGNLRLCEIASRNAQSAQAEQSLLRRVRDCRVCLASVDYDSQPKICPHCGAENPLAD